MGFGRRGSASVIDLGQHKQSAAEAVDAFADIVRAVREQLLKQIDPSQIPGMARGALAKELTDLAADCNLAAFEALNLLEQRRVVTAILNELVPGGNSDPSGADDAVEGAEPATFF